LSLIYAEPHFIPNISINGVTSITVTLWWNVPPHVSEYYNYYNVTVRSKGGKGQLYEAKGIPFMVDQLKPGTDYTFKVIKTIHILFSLLLDFLNTEFVK
jgi:hypothetical protein